MCLRQACGRAKLPGSGAFPRDFYGPGVGGASGQGLFVVPGHPPARILLERFGIPGGAQQVVIRIGPVGHAGLDHAHEEVAHRRSSFRLVMQAVLRV